MCGGTEYAWSHNPWVWVVEFRKLEVKQPAYEELGKLP